MDHFLTNAKAYAALVGAVLTAVAGTLGKDTPAGIAVAVALAVCTAIATWTVPNKTKTTTTAPAPVAPTTDKPTA